MQTDVLFTLVLPCFLKQLAGFHQLRERSGISTFIFASLLCKANLIPPTFLQIIQDAIFNLFRCSFSAIIFVDTPPDKCLLRAQKRNEKLVAQGDLSRVHEIANLSLEYLQALHQEHINVLSQLQVPVIIINGSATPAQVFQQFTNIFNAILCSLNLPHTPFNPQAITYLTKHRLQYPRNCVHPTAPDLFSTFRYNTLSDH